MDRLDDNYSSPFRGSPFERRFRGIHTVSQQIRSRDAHYETGDQDILRKPRSFFSRSRPRAFTAAGSAGRAGNAEVKEGLRGRCINFSQIVSLAAFTGKNPG